MTQRSLDKKTKDLIRKLQTSVTSAKRRQKSLIWFYKIEFLDIQKRWWHRSQGQFVLGMQVWFNIWRSTQVIHHIDKWNKKNNCHVFRCRRETGKIQYTFVVTEILSKLIVTVCYSYKEKLRSMEPMREPRSRTTWSPLSSETDDNGL